MYTVHRTAASIGFSYFYLSYIAIFHVLQLGSLHYILLCTRMYSQ